MLQHADRFDVPRLTGPQLEHFVANKVRNPGSDLPLSTKIHINLSGSRATGNYLRLLVFKDHGVI